MVAEDAVVDVAVEEVEEAADAAPTRRTQRSPHRLRAVYLPLEAEAIFPPLVDVGGASSNRGTSRTPTNVTKIGIFVSAAGMMCQGGTPAKHARTSAAGPDIRRATTAARTSNILRQGTSPQPKRITRPSCRSMIGTNDY